MSNILALPHATVSVETGNNEDWIESFKFVVDDGAGSPEMMPQLDLRGIDFEMEVRRNPGDHEVLISATIENRKLALGAFPNYGFLLFNINIGEMQTKSAGTYFADVIATDGEFTRKCMTISVMIKEGVTR